MNVCVGLCPARCVCTALLWVYATMCLLMCTVGWHTPARASWCACVCVSLCMCTCFSWELPTWVITCVKGVGTYIHVGVKGHVSVHVAIAVEEYAHLLPYLIRIHVCPYLFTSLHRRLKQLSRFAVSAEMRNFCVSHTYLCLHGAGCVLTC